MDNNKGRLTAAVWAIALSLQGIAKAEESRSIDFTGSGFFTAAAGKVLRGSHDAASDLGYRCPCFISDYGQGGVYESGRVNFGPDSRLGLQGTASTIDRRFSVTGQVVARGALDGGTTLEWLYGTAELTSQLTLQVGRKRLPLFTYSEVQDVGYALPWAHLPPQLYGWEIVNFNGASLTWRDSLGPWATTANLFGGGETRRDSGYWKIYNGKDSRTDVRWSNILGLELKAQRDWFEARYVNVRSKVQNRLVSAGESDFGDATPQLIQGLSFSVEQGRWFGRAELLFIDRRQDYGRDYAQMIGVGYRIGRWTPFVSFSNYRQRLNPGIGPYEAHRTTSLVVRYDLDNASAVKVQYDYWLDRSEAGFASQHGNAQLLTISYDRVFP